MDIKKKLIGSNYEIYTHNGKKKTGKCPITFAKHLEEVGVGEVILNCIDNDGIMKGYDFTLVEKIRGAINVPLTVLGGAGSLHDIGKLIKKCGVIGAAAGSLFVFKGIYRAVLINYPNRLEKDALIEANYGIS
jgi:cyclase